MMKTHGRALQPSTPGASGNGRRLQGHLQKQGGTPGFANPLRTGAAGCYVPFRQRALSQA